MMDDFCDTSSTRTDRSNEDGAGDWDAYWVEAGRREVAKLRVECTDEKIMQVISAHIPSTIDQLYAYLLTPNTRPRAGGKLVRAVNQYGEDVPVTHPGFFDLCNQERGNVIVQLIQLYQDDYRTTRLVDMFLEYWNSLVLGQIASLAVARAYDACSNEHKMRFHKAVVPRLDSVFNHEYGNFIIGRMLQMMNPEFQDPELCDAVAKLLYTPHPCGKFFGYATTKAGSHSLEHWVKNCPDHHFLTLVQPLLSGQDTDTEPGEAVENDADMGGASSFRNFNGRAKLRNSTGASSMAWKLADHPKGNYPLQKALTRVQTYLALAQERELIKEAIAHGLAPEGTKLEEVSATTETLMMLALHAKEAIPKLLGGARFSTACAKALRGGAAPSNGNSSGGAQKQTAQFALPNQHGQKDQVGYAAYDPHSMTLPTAAEDEEDTVIVNGKKRRVRGVRPPRNNNGPNHNHRGGQQGAPPPFAHPQGAHGGQYQQIHTILQAPPPPSFSQYENTTVSGGGVGGGQSVNATPFVPGEGGGAATTSFTVTGSSTSKPNYPPAGPTNNIHHQQQPQQIIVTSGGPPSMFATGGGQQGQQPPMFTGQPGQQLFVLHA